MTRPRPIFALLAGVIGAAAILFGAPIAAADECQTDGGGDGGQSMECVSPGNAQLNASPNDLGIQGAMVDEIGGAFGGFGGR